MGTTSSTPCCQAKPAASTPRTDAPNNHHNKSSLKQAKMAIARHLDNEAFYTALTQASIANSIAQVLENKPELAPFKFPFYWQPQRARAETLLTIFVWHDLGEYMLNRVLAVHKGEGPAALQATLTACRTVVQLEEKDAPRKKKRSVQWLLDKCACHEIEVDADTLEKLNQLASSSNNARTSASFGKKHPSAFAPQKSYTKPSAMVSLSSLFSSSCSIPNDDHHSNSKGTKRLIVQIFNEEPFYQPLSCEQTAKHILTLLAKFPELARDKFPFFWLAGQQNGRARAGTPLTIFVWHLADQPDIWNATLDLSKDKKHALHGTLKGLSNLLQTDQYTLAESSFLWLLSKCQEQALDPSILINALLANRNGLKGNPKPLVQPETLTAILELDNPPPALDFAIFFQDQQPLEILQQIATHNPLHTTELTLSLPSRQEFVFDDTWATMAQSLIPQLTRLEVRPSNWTAPGFALFLNALQQSTTLANLTLQMNLQWVASEQAALQAWRDFFRHKPPALRHLELVGGVHPIMSRGIRDPPAPVAFQALWEGLQVATANGGNRNKPLDQLHLHNFYQLPAQLVAQLGQYVQELHLKDNKLFLAAAGFHHNDDNNNPIMEAKARAWKDAASSLDVHATFQEGGDGGLTHLVLKADACTGYYDSDVTQGIVGVIQDEPWLEELDIQARFTHHYRHGSRHSHRLHTRPFCEAIQSLAALRTLKLMGARLCCADRRDIPSLFFQAMQRCTSLQTMDVCDGKEFFAWDQVPYLKDTHFVDYRTAVHIWCISVLRQNRQGDRHSLPQLLEAVVQVQSTDGLDPNHSLSSDIRKLRAVKSEDELHGRVPWIEGKLTDDSVLDPFISPVYELLSEAPGLWCLQAQGGV